MKLRFGIDVAARDRIRDRLDAMSVAAPEGRRTSDVYLDTPNGDLASRGIALRFRRRGRLATASQGYERGGGWRRQEIWSKAQGRKAGALKKLGIHRLKQRLDATFTVRTDRWTWRLRDGWARVSLAHSRVSTGDASECFFELRIVCKRRQADAATKLAVELGATHRASRRARERGWALLDA